MADASLDSFDIPYDTIFWLESGYFCSTPRKVKFRALQKILGYDRLATTEFYLNLSPENVSRECLCAHRRAGVNTLQVNPDGQTLDERLATLARLVELVKEINAEP